MTGPWMVVVGFVVVENAFAAVVAVVEVDVFAVVAAF